MASTRPAWASETTDWTPDRPRAISERRKASQPAEVREGGRIINFHALIAVGVNANGHRETFGLDVATTGIGMPQSKAFRQSLYSGAGVGQSHIDSIAAVSRDYDRTGPAPAQSEYKAAATALQDMQCQNKMGAYSDKASATKDLGRWIGGQHLRDFLMQTPLAAELQSQEDKLRGADRTADAYANFVTHLLRLPGGE